MTLLCTNWEVTKFKPDPKILLRVLNMTASKLARVLLTVVLTLMKLVRNKKISLVDFLSKALKI